MASSNADDGQGAPDDPARPAHGAKRSARDRWFLLALLLLALGIGFGLGAGLSPYLQSSPAAAVPAPVCAEVVASSGAAAVPLDQPCSAATAASEQTRTEDSALLSLWPEARRPRSAKTARKQGAASPAQAAPADAGAPGAPASAPGPDLHEALQLLRAAQQALKAAEAARALSLLEQMDRRVPGVLVEERDVTRALAYCAANDVEGARRTAAALRQSGLAPLYAHRLSKSCVGPEPAPAGLLEEMRRRALN